MPGISFKAAELLIARMRALWGRVARSGGDRGGASAERILIYGTGPVAQTFAASLVDWRHVSVIGFVDPASATCRAQNGLPVWSDQALSRILRQERPDRVVIADPSLPERAVLDLVWRVASPGCRAETVVEFLERMHGDNTVRHLTDALIEAIPSQPAGLLLGAPNDDIAGRVVLVTGAGGTIGGEICAQLIGLSPATIVMVDHSEFALVQIDRKLACQADATGVSLIPVLGSITDPVFIGDTITRFAPDIILHAAAYKHVNIVEDNPRAGIINNTLGTAVIAQKARESRVGKFVLISTDKAMHPANIMGASKRFAELVVQDMAARSEVTTFTIVRFGNVAGSSGSVLPLFREQISRGGPVTLTHPDATRYFMTVQQAGHLVLAASRLSAGGEIFALDMGPPIRIRDLARRMIAASGRTIRDASYPRGEIEILTTGLRPGEKLHETRLVRAHRIPTGHPRIFVLPEKILSEIQVAGLLRDLREATEHSSDDDLRATIGHWLEVDRWAATDGVPGPRCQSNERSRHMVHP